jgi:hypothetical protein
LTASQSAASMQVNLNERFSEVIATVLQQYLQKRWNSVSHPEKWELNTLMNTKTSGLKKKTLKAAEIEHVHRALILSQYDIEFARELLDASIPHGKGKEAADDEDEEEAPQAQTQSSSSSSSSTLPAPVDVPLTTANVQPANLPGSSVWIDQTTPWMSKQGVHFSCDQCGSKIYSVCWICTVCNDYDLCDGCHSAYVDASFCSFLFFFAGRLSTYLPTPNCRGWQSYSKGHTYNHAMVPMRYQSASASSVLHFLFSNLTRASSQPLQGCGSRVHNCGVLRSDQPSE